MQKLSELDWVGYVLRDVVTFLCDNNMMQSAQMLAVATAHIEHDMRRNSEIPPTTPQAEAKVVAFSAKIRRLN